MSLSSGNMERKTDRMGRRAAAFLLTLCMKCFSCRVDPYGFERRHDFESYKEMMNEYVAVLDRRSMRWSKLLQEKPHVEKNVTGITL